MNDVFFFVRPRLWVSALLVLLFCFSKREEEKRREEKTGVRREEFSLESGVLRIGALFFSSVWWEEEICGFPAPRLWDWLRMSGVL